MDHPCNLTRTTVRISFPELKGEVFVNLLGYKEPNLIPLWRCKGIFHYLESRKSHHPWTDINILELRQAFGIKNIKGCVRVSSLRHTPTLKWDRHLLPSFYEYNLWAAKNSINTRCLRWDGKPHSLHSHQGAAEEGPDDRQDAPLRSGQEGAA